MKIIAVTANTGDWNLFVENFLKIPNVRYIASVHRLILPNDVVYVHIINPLFVRGYILHGILTLSYPNESQQEIYNEALKRIRSR